MKMVCCPKTNFPVQMGGSNLVNGSKGGTRFVQYMCGDWCPLFGEPIEVDRSGSDEKGAMFQICDGKTLDLSDGFGDQRNVIDDKEAE